MISQFCSDICLEMSCHLGYMSLCVEIWLEL